MFNDKIISDQLAEIKQHHFEAYLILKQNISAIYKKLAMAEADHAFNDIRNSKYIVYYLDISAQGLMGIYLNTDIYNFDKCYIAPIHGYYACVYFTNKHGFIMDRKHILGNKNVDDLYATFGPYMTEINDNNQFVGGTP